MRRWRVMTIAPPKGARLSLDGFQAPPVGLLAFGPTKSAVGFRPLLPGLPIVGIQGNGLGELVNGLLVPSLIEEFNSPRRQVGWSGNRSRLPRSRLRLGWRVLLHGCRRCPLGDNRRWLNDRRWRRLGSCPLLLFLCCVSWSPGVGSRSFRLLLPAGLFGLLFLPDRGFASAFRLFHGGSGQVPTTLDTKVQASGVRGAATGAGSSIGLPVLAKQGTTE